MNNKHIYTKVIKSLPLEETISFTNDIIDNALKGKIEMDNTHLHYYISVNRYLHYILFLKENMI